MNKPTDKGIEGLRKAVAAGDAGCTECGYMQNDIPVVLATIDQMKEREVALTDALAALIEAHDGIENANYWLGKVRTDDDAEDADRGWEEADKKMQAALKHARSLIGPPPSIVGIRRVVLSRAIQWLKGFAKENVERGKDARSTKEFTKSTTRSLAIRQAADEMEKSLLPEIVRGD